MNEPSILFFPGKHTPLKRYVSYFKAYFNLTVSGPHEKSVILCHSAGVNQALQYVSDREQKDVTIVCMDPSSVERMGTRLIAFRQDKFKEDQAQNQLYQQVIFYSPNTHYPFEVKKVRNQIVQTVLQHIPERLSSFIKL